LLSIKKKELTDLATICGGEPSGLKIYAPEDCCIKDGTSATTASI